MAFLTFLNRRKPVAIYQLRGIVTLGRSMDCDIYIPDVFVSRRHCRIEMRQGSWRVVDGDSRNGVWYEGRRQDDYLLKPGDTIEIGTIAFTYNEGSPEGVSNPVPYGMGLGVTELMDTVFAQDLRPSAYTKQQTARRQEFARRVKLRLSQQEPEEIDAVVAVDHEPWRREEWAELDMELQIAEGQAQMTDWEPPIFNPKKRMQLSDSLDEDKADYKISGTAIAAKAHAIREHDSIDEEVAQLVASGRRSPMAGAVGQSRKPLLRRIGARLHFARHRSPQVVDGVEIESYTWWDRIRDGVRERIGFARSYAAVNPTIAVGVVLGVVLLVAGSAKLWQARQADAYHSPKTYTAEEMRRMNAAN